MTKSYKGVPNKSYVNSPRSVDEAWAILATNILLLAIEDVRQERDVLKRAKAKEWLISPAAKLFFETIIAPDFDIPEWVEANCPVLGNQ